ncbi:MAG TPA: glycosyltransferase family 4 protein [Thermodesulfobacteriota bacterium]
MKILMIAPEPFFEPRGTPFSILGRLKALSRLGHSVDLLTYHVGDDVVIEGIRILRTPQLRFIREVPIGPSYRKVLLDILLVVNAFIMLVKERYDLVHTHEEASIFGTVLAKVFGIRHLYDFHSSIPQVMRNFVSRQFLLLIPALEWIERLVVNASDGVIAISPALRDYVRTINKSVPIMVIENIIEALDQESITAEKISEFENTYSQFNGKKIVLYTGTFEPYQGLELLISCAERVLQHRKDVIFALVGGKKHQIDKLREIVVGLGISSHFYFTGIRPPAEMPLFMNIAQTLVSPRLNGNNTPLKIYSYLQSGKPIVATNITAHNQILNDDIAILVDPDPDSMAQAILSVLDDSSLATKLGARARLYFKSRCSFREYIDKTEEILDMVYERRS